jgi:hypothetical protein
MATKTWAAPAALHFGKISDRRELAYARRGNQGPLLLVSSDMVKRLSAGPLVFASRRVLEFRKDDAVAVHLTRPSGNIGLEKEGDKWVIIAPDRAEANAAAVEDFLWTFSYVEAKEIVVENPARLDPYGLDAPRMKASILLSSLDGRSKQQRVLLVGKELPNRTSYAMIEGGARVFAIGQRPIEQIMADFTVKPPK